MANNTDGPRKFGYGGFKYIPGRLTPLANKIIKAYKSYNKSKILDVDGKVIYCMKLKKYCQK